MNGPINEVQYEEQASAAIALYEQKLGNAADAYAQARHDAQAELDSTLAKLREAMNAPGPAPEPPPAEPAGQPPVATPPPVESPPVEPAP